MYVSREEALAAHEARYKLRTCKAGQAWVFCPYVPGAVYSTGHYVDKERGWEQCPGAGLCKYHHLRTIAKLHVPALVLVRAQLAMKADNYQPPAAIIPFRPADWSQKIVELTGGTFAAFSVDSHPDQLAIVWRPEGRNNGPLHFRWLKGVLDGVPNNLAHFQVRDILPAIIHGQVCVDNIKGDLTKYGEGPIKHNLPYQTLEPDNREYPQQMYRGEPDKFNRDDLGEDGMAVPA